MLILCYFESDYHIKNIFGIIIVSEKRGADLKWREILIGALISMAITIAGGVTVWQLTREPPKPPAKADIIFQADTPAKFKSKSKDLAFYTVRVGNVGEKAAKEVYVSIIFNKKSVITDSAVTISSGAAAHKNQTEIASDSNEKLVRITSLMPGEIITTSLLVKDSSAVQPVVSARHADGIGRENRLVGGKSTIDVDPESRAEKAALAALLLGILIPVMIFRLRKKMGGLRSVNNSAFMILNQGMVEEAKRMLETEIASRGGTAFELANLGLCLALSDNREGGEKLFRAAELYSSANSIKLLVEFSRAIAAHKNGENDSATSHFSNAWNESKRGVRRYLKFSELAQRMVQECEEISTLVEKNQS